MRFLRGTLAALARTLAGVGHSELDVLFYRYGLEDDQVRGNCTCLDKALAFVKAVEGRKTPAEAEQILSEAIQRVLSRVREWHLHKHKGLTTLLAALNLDGFDFRNGRLVAATPAPAMLAPEMSALESDLAAMGMVTASEHYRQATDNFTDGNWEASNGQTRSFLEDFLITACERESGRAFRDPNGALQHLRDTTFLDAEEWNILRSLWSGVQNNGPHRGLSSDQEALFRVHMATAVARYLVHKLQPAP
jgi:hypothetical protein